MQRTQANITHYIRNILHIPHAENILDPTHQEQQTADDELVAKINEFIGMKDTYKIQQAINPMMHIKKYLVIFINTTRSYGTTDPNVLQWNVSYNASGGQGIVQFPSNTGRIVGMRFAGGLRFLTTPVAYQSFIWFSGLSSSAQQLTITIDEFKDQAFISPPFYNDTHILQVRPFHFIADMTPQYYELYPPDTFNYLYADVSAEQYGQGYYWFRYPYIPPQTITMTFGAPYLPFNLPTNEVSCAAQSVANILRLTSVKTMIDVGPFYIRGFTTTDSIADAALIEYVNHTLHTNSIITFLGFFIIQVDFPDINLTGVALPANLTCQLISTRSPMYCIPIEFYYTEQ